MALDVKRIVAKNLQALLDYAADHGAAMTGRELARVAKVNHKTIQRLLKAENAVACDTLQAVAGVFDLQAWQMLIPDIDPANPPVIWMTETERQLHKRLQTVAKDYVNSLESHESETSTPSPASPDPASSRRISRGTSRKPAKVKTPP